MGILVYDSNEVSFDDYVLAHVQIAIGVKLRRGERFYFSWQSDETTGGGRTSIWLHPGIPLTFKYDSPEMPKVNLAWIEALIATAYSPGGLRLIPEPESEQTLNEQVLK